MMLGFMLAAGLELSGLQAGSWTLPASRPCTAEQMAALTAPPDARDTPYRLTCRAVLNGGRITRRILVEGAEASGAGIDCGGGAIGRPGVARTTRAPTLAVWSRPVERSDAAFSRPTDIEIRRCTVHGSVRIWGMGAGEGMAALRDSSRTSGHTAAAQAAAPSHVVLQDVTFAASGSIPLYVGPGVTRTEVIGGRFIGRSDSVAVYLDAESAGNEIRGVRFDIATPREKIAVDGSARNRIVDNRLALGGQGGVFLYRNCGEDGVIRHQTPSDNVITGNVFTGVRLFRPQTVVVGAREGGRRYCGDDRGYPFGSSADDGDHAERNVVRNNTIQW